MIGLCLVAVFAMAGLAASSASALPKWNVNGAALAGKENITFTSVGVTKLVTPNHTIECEKAKQGTGTNQIENVGGTGVAHAVIQFEKCNVNEGLIKCKAKSKGAAEETIVTNVNDELTFRSNAKSTPLGLVFKTTKAKSKPFVELEFSGICSLLNGTVNATGVEHGPAIEGVAGVVCKIEGTPEKEENSHEINCVKAEQTKFFYEEGGLLKEGKAGLEFNKEVSEQVGKGKIKASGTNTYSAKST
jgi:hypothetical protein